LIRSFTWFENANVRLSTFVFIQDNSPPVFANGWHPRRLPP
jgi:hypothetical protein